MDKAIEQHCKIHHNGKLEPDCELCRSIMKLLKEVRRSAA
jgi:hypothetical protein